jgi:uncharacterized membrane protein
VYHSTVVLLRRAFLVAAIAWAIALPLAAWIASWPHASAAVSTMTIATYGIGSIVCHQLPERSFHLGAAQLPVCARCTGIYFGAALAACVLTLRRGGACSALAERHRATSKVRASNLAANEVGPGKLGPYTVRAIVVGAAIPALATLIYEWTTGDVPSNWVRFATGLPLGIVASWLVRAPAVTRPRNVN